MSHVEHQLGPFAPPKEYQFEPELLGKLPRIIPPELRQGIHGLSAYNTLRACLIVGLLCVALAETSFVQTVGMYFLPLKFTRWIGAAVLAFAAFKYLKDARESGPYLWVKNGTPFIARVISMVAQPTLYYNGQPTQWKIFAAFEYEADGAVQQQWTTSFDLGTSPHLYTTSYKVGDYVTGLYVDDPSPENRRTLYGFLGLKPGLGVIYRDPSTDRFHAMLKGIAAVFGITGAVFALLIHGVRVVPYEMPGQNFWWVNAAVTCLAAIPLHVWLKRRADAKRAAWQAAQELAHSKGEPVFSDPQGANVAMHTRGATALAMFGLFLAQIFGLWGLNAALDRSQPVLWPAHIERLIHTTWNGCIRDYSIKWKKYDPATDKVVGSEQSFLTTASHLERFKTRAAVAHIGEGAFGWKWVVTVEPWESPQ